jgi:hypothetical protein
MPVTKKGHVGTLHITIFSHANKNLSCIQKLSYHTTKALPPAEKWWPITEIILLFTLLSSRIEKG